MVTGPACVATVLSTGGPASVDPTPSADGAAGGVGWLMAGPVRVGPVPFAGGVADCVGRLVGGGPAGRMAQCAGGPACVDPASSAGGAGWLVASRVGVGPGGWRSPGAGEAKGRVGWLVTGVDPAPSAGGAAGCAGRPMACGGGAVAGRRCGDPGGRRPQSADGPVGCAGVPVTEPAGADPVLSTGWGGWLAAGRGCPSRGDALSAGEMTGSVLWLRCVGPGAWGPSADGVTGSAGWLMAGLAAWRVSCPSAGEVTDSAG